MSYDELLDAVAARSGIEERGDVERTVVDVLQELCDRLTGDEQLDPEYADLLA